MSADECNARAKRFSRSRNLSVHWGETRAEIVRATTEGRIARAFCVIDDGKSDFPAHALICLAERDAWTRGSVRRLRCKLLDVIVLRHREESIAC